MSQFKLKYASNAKGWITSAVFTEYCKELNGDLITQKRKILMVLDNFSGHRINNLSNIVFVFLPPNITSILQPLDKGIISVFKKKYGKKLNCFLSVTFKTLIKEQRRL